MTPRRSTRIMIVALVVVLAFSAAAFAGGAGRTSGVYVSKRFHYSLQVPTGFKRVPATSDALPGFYPTGESVAADRFLHGAYKFAIDSSATPQTLGQWTRARAKLIAQHFGCDKPKTSHVPLGGASAVQLDYKICAGVRFVAIEAVHNGRGYDVFWLGGASIKPALVQDIATFKFLP